MNATKFALVPTCVSDAINLALDMAIAEFPEAAPDREIFYSQLLEYFDTHGEIPEFSLERSHDR